jgi:hypothetical protein
MASSQTNRDDKQREMRRELERYREAATGALEQLEWCVEYLHRIHKPEIAKAISRNRRKILERVG